MHVILYILCTCADCFLLKSNAINDSHFYAYNSGNTDLNFAVLKNKNIIITLFYKVH